MRVFRRSDSRFYWYEFEFRGARVQRSAKVTNARDAMDIAAAHRTRLAKGEVGIIEREQAPTLEQFVARFMKSVRTRRDKTNTVSFYEQQSRYLLDYPAFAIATLDRIDAAMIERFVSWRRRQVSVASVNRALATLRRMLRLAVEWKVIDRAPVIHLLRGEAPREFTLSRELEPDYLDGASNELRIFAMLALDTGLRASELLALPPTEVHFAKGGGGYLTVRRRFAKSGRERSVPLTARAERVLRELVRELPRGAKRILEGWPTLNALEREHRRIREALGLPAGFVLHSFRHTFGTRLGESGADAFTIMKLMGHQAVTTSQKYVHPVAASLQQAVRRLEAEFPEVPTGEEKIEPRSRRK